MIGKCWFRLHAAIPLLSMSCMFALAPSPLEGQTPANPPLAAAVPINADRLAPKYPIPYGPATLESIQEILNRIHGYLDECTPARLIDSKTKEPVADIGTPSADAVLEQGSFSIVSYEWGLAYAGMLSASEATGDGRFSDYAAKRINFLARLFPYYQKQMQIDPKIQTPIRSVVNPRSLDDSGAMCAAIIKARRAGIAPDAQPLIDNYIRYIREGQLRLEDGTLARNGPFPNTLWLDDLYMSVPALAQMGKTTGDRAYFDDAVRQILQFASRMFVREKNLYMHGWVQGMTDHPAFHWARANGWAILAATELLDVLPENYPGREQTLDLLRTHIRGLAACQSGQGLWHQLLDRNDSYLETSASAMFTYCIAHAISRGWIDRQAYEPVVQLAWKAVAAKVNDRGQVEGTCIGTGMQFDPMFYYYRPTSVFAAHGYGSILLAGSEMMRLLKK